MKSIFGLLIMMVGGFVFQFGFRLCDKKTQLEFSEKFYKMIKAAE